MERKTLALLTVLSLLVLSGAAMSNTALEDYMNGMSQRLKTEGQAFTTAAQAGAGTIPITFNSVFEAFDPGYCGPDLMVFDPAWIGPTAAAVMVVLFGVALLYMLGQLLQMPGLLATAKEEGIQVFYSALRIGFMLLIVTMLNSWFSVRTNGVTDPGSIYALHSTDPHNLGGSLTVIDASMAFCRSMIVEMVTNYSNLVMYNMVVHTVYSSTMWFGVTYRTMYSFNLGPVLKPLIDIIGMALQFLSLGISEWMLHLVLLCMIKKYTWSLFIPIAVFLRAIPQTRGAGEALFAIVLALFLIYPFMFIVTYETHKIMRGNLVDSASALQSFVSKSGILAVAGSVLVVMFLAAGVFFPFFLGSALGIAFELIRNAVYYVIIMSLLLPFLNIFVTLTAAKEFAKFFNVDVSFMSFIKII